MTFTDKDLQPLVAQWLPVQRWFAGKGRPAPAITVRRLEVLADTAPELSLWLAVVTYDDDSVETYQLPLVARSEPVPTLEHVLLGSVSIDRRPHWIYDALHDKDVTQIWLTGIRDEITLGPIRFARVGEPDYVPIGQPSLVLTSEQSNTSLVYGDQAILKFFRRLQGGINPDIEVHKALTELGARHIARLLGSVTADIDGEPTSLAMLQEFMTTATDGWELAKTSVRDLMAEADLHADEAGGDFAGEAERLGVATAETHADLAEAFGTSALSAGDLAARADAMHARLDAAIKIVPQLADVEDSLRKAYDAFGEAGSRTTPLTTQRIHGDLHLGQVLRTVRRFVVLDFEGEPISAMTSRRAFDSPLRDVASMLRSFDYAARHQIVDSPGTAQLEYRADEWAQRNRNAFRAGYTAASGHELDDDVVLRGFEADKAVYEAVYEARNRPSWLAIPLASLGKLGGDAP